MPREQLLGLAADVDRLLAAGAGAALSNEGLARRARTLRELGQKVPALLPVADAVDKLTGAAPKQAGPAFLELLVTARQLRASLSACGLPGELAPAPESGPWQTELSVRELRPLHEALAGSGAGREETLRSAADRGELTDLRLVPALAEAVGDGNAEVAELVAEEVLPEMGRGAAPEVAARVGLRGGAADVRRLRLVCRLDPELGARLCRRAAVEGAAALRGAALEALPDLVPAAEAERLGLEAIKDGDGDVRAAGFAALRKASGDAALEALLAAHADRSDEARRAAAAALNSLAHPAATDRLLTQLREDLAALAALPVAPKAKPAPKPAKGKGKGKAAKVKAAPAKKEEDPARKRLIRKLSWLALAVGGRPDQRAAVSGMLLPLTRHADEALRAAAVESLGGGAGDPEVKRALLAALDGKPALRAAALKALAKLPPAERLDAAPRALELARDHRVDLAERKTAFAVLAGLEDRFGPAIVQALVKISKETSWRVWSLISSALEGMGKQAAPLVPDLMDGLIGSRYSHAVCPLLPRLDPDGSRGVPKLIEMLGGLKKGAQPYAILFALQQYGSRARAAVPLLEQMMEKSPSWHYFARSTLRKIER
jgi:hypothetical protein